MITHTVMVSFKISSLAYTEALSKLLPRLVTKVMVTNEKLDVLRENGLKVPMEERDHHDVIFNGARADKFFISHVKDKEDHSKKSHSKDQDDGDSKPKNDSHELNKEEHKRDRKKFPHNITGII